MMNKNFINIFIMKEKFNPFIFLILLSSITPLICFQNGDKFTSAEIAIPFKTLNEKDSVVFKTKVLGEEKNCSIDITSSEQLLYISEDYFPKENLKNKELCFITDQNLNKIEGYRDNIELEFVGDEYRKGVTIENINSFLIKTNDISKIHSLGFSHDIKPENSIVHQLYNSHMITKRQFSILFLYPDWGTLSFGKEGTVISDFENSLSRKCSAVKGSYWGCHLSGIYIENVELPLEEEKIRKNNINIKVEQDTIFDIGIGNILVPEEIFEFFYNKFFDKKLFEEKRCTLYKNDKIKKIKCDGIEKNKNINEFEKFKRIHFVFDDIVDIYVLGKYFFDEEKNFRIINIKKNKNIVIGKCFLSKYNMIYNYDENTIKFFGMFGGRYMEQKLDYNITMKNYLVSNTEYHRYSIEKIDKNIFPLFKILLVFGIVLNAIIFFAVCKINKKNKKKKLLEKLKNKDNY